MNISAIQRKILFLYYLLKPFRFLMIKNQLFKRAGSLFNLKSGFRVIDLAISYECNLNCSHCSAKCLEKSEKKLSLDDYKKIVKDAKKLDNLSWNITGGEPLLVDWLDDLIGILDPSQNYISIQTNCMLLSYKRAKELKKLGVNCITTSLDSCIPEKHNEFRSSSISYDRVISGIKNARKAGMQVLVGGIVTHSNIRSGELEDLIKMVNNLGAIFLFNLAVPCGNWKNNKAVIITKADREYLLGLMDKYPATSTDHEPGRNKKGCPAGMEKIYITAYGDVLPCPFIHVSFGNVKDSSLDEIVKKMRKIPQFGSYPDICVAAEDPYFHNEIFPAIDLSEKNDLPAACETVFHQL